MHDMFRVRERGVKLERKLCPDTVIFSSELDPFMSAVGMIQRDGPGASTLNSYVLSSLAL